MIRDKNVAKIFTEQSYRTNERPVIDSAIISRNKYCVHPVTIEDKRETK